MKCAIKWIDKSGQPTPDDNDAVMLVRTVDRVQQIGGRGIRFAASQWFPICECHAKQLSDPGMHIWECKSLDEHVAT